MARARGKARALVAQFAKGRPFGILGEPSVNVLELNSAAQGYVVANLGHPWNLQAPDLYARVVRAWINDKPLPQEALEAIK